MVNLEEMDERLKKVELGHDKIEKIASATIMEGDKTMKDYGTQIAIKAAKHAIKEFKKQADEHGNNDGQTSVKEGIDYGMSLFNGNGVLLIFGILVSTIIGAGFMLWRGIIDWDTFLLVSQLIASPTISSYIIKVIVNRLGNKTSVILEDNKRLKEENTQLYLNLELKKAHDKEFNGS